MIFETSISPDISFGKRLSIIKERDIFSLSKLRIVLNMGLIIVSKIAKVSSSALIIGYDLRISVLRLVNTLPFPKLTKSLRIYLKKRYK